MTSLQRIRNEFDEPIKETIKGFAVQGHSRRAVAQIMEIPFTTTLRLVKRFDCDKYFKKWKDMRPECKGPGWPKGKARK